MSRKIVSSKQKKNTPAQPAESVFAHRLLLLPLVLMIGLVPLLMRTTIYQTGLSVYDWFPDGAEVTVDIFFIIKKYAIITLGILMGAILLFRLLLKKAQKPDRMFLFLGIYAAFVLLSGIFSVNWTFSFTGSYERFESVFVVLSYVITVLYAYTYVRSLSDLKFVLILGGIGILITLLIGFFQGLYLDLFKTDFGKKLISSEEFRSSYGELSVTMEPGRAYSTLYNPDFFSLYTCTLLPVAAALLFAANRIWKRIVYILVAILMIIVTKMAWAESVWFGLAAGAFFLFMLLMSREKKQRIVSLSILACLTVAGCLLLPKFVDRYSSEAPYEARKIREIDTKDRDVVFTTMEGEQLSVTAEPGEETGVVTVSDPALLESLGGSAAYAKDEGGNWILNVSVDGRGWRFVNLENSWYFLNPAYKPEKLPKEINRADLFPDRFLSSRGSIWNYSVAVLPSHLLLGSGADTFVLVYPQDDYLRKNYNSWGLTATYDVKPHSFYLQQWIEHGLVALVALMIFLIWYIVTAFRLVHKAGWKDREAILGIGFVVAVVSTLIAFLVNDSNVCTSPIFWTIVGLGTAVNRILLTRRAGQETPKDNPKK